MRLIDADVLLDETVRRNSAWNSITNSEGKNLEEIVSEIPSVNPQELKNGSWFVENNSKKLCFDLTCSNCGYMFSVPHGERTPKYTYKYCPICGSKNIDI